MPPTFDERLPQAMRAAEYAERRHRGQRRTNGAPFIDHPLEVAALLYRLGASDHVIAAGLLHDVLEKTDTGQAELHARFGSRVTALVAAVSEDPDIDSDQDRKAELRARMTATSDDALSVFAADKLSKVRELRPTSRFARDPDGRSLARSARELLDHYHECLAILEWRIPNNPLVHDLREELGAAAPARRSPQRAARARLPLGTTS
jgi:(p)ppGpp synthase/HD superfamily hydrolase